MVFLLKACSGGVSSVKWPIVEDGEIDNGIGTGYTYLYYRSSMVGEVEKKVVDLESWNESLM